MEVREIGSGVPARVVRAGENAGNAHDWLGLGREILTVQSIARLLSRQWMPPGVLPRRMPIEQHGKPVSDVCVAEGGGGRV